ncbi:MAG TPA: chromosomal replication initiator protein DnaA [Thermodesulfobacteriota bacterium]|nr:chromosomal replication initiator protein DnaA [Thermodesulfobacteriota bacterium]
MAKKVTLGRSLRSLFNEENEESTNERGIELLISPSRTASFTSTSTPQKVIPKKGIIWEEVIERLRQKSNPQVFFWFAPIKLASQTDESVTLKVKSSFEKDWISNHYIDLISETIREVEGRNFGVNITVEEDNLPPLDEPPTVTEEEYHTEESHAAETSSKDFFSSSLLNPHYTFERFIVGSSNQFAHAASIAVARKPGEAYNPLFVYGGVGLGKTHLINAIGNYILQKTSSQMARVCCISAEHFTNQVINSIKSNKMEEFRNRYRFGCDVLLIDDIQFIAGKESTQEEFFHTFNTLYESKKQIVLTSDKSPKDMSYLEERLRSRFEWGLITDIQPPETETKVAILKKKAEAEGIELPNEVAIFLAQHITSNIRELEGSLINISAYAKLLNTEITIDLAKEVLKNIVRENAKKVMSIESIQKEVANFFGIRIQDMKSEKKIKTIAVPRQIAMYLARRYTGASFPEIGEKFGGKDHSTVIHAVRKIEGMIGEDITLRNTINVVSRKLDALRNSG